MTAQTGKWFTTGKGTGVVCGGSCTDGTSIYLYGGSVSGNTTSKLRTWDDESEQWTTLIEGPQGVADCSCTWMNNAVVVIGGRLNGTSIHDSIKLSSSTFAWRPETGKGSTFNNYQLPQPYQCYGHTATAISQRSCVVFGGRVSKHKFRTGLYLLQIPSFPILKNTQPNITPLMVSSGVSPSVRSAHSATFNTKMETLVIAGGVCHGKPLHDIHLLHYPSMTWREICVPTRVNNISLIPMFNDTILCVGSSKSLVLDLTTQLCGHVANFSKNKSSPGSGDIVCCDGFIYQLSLTESYAVSVLDIPAKVEGNVVGMMSEIWFLIFDYLTDFDILNISQTCSEIRCLSVSDVVWTPKLQKFTAKALRYALTPSAMQTYCKLESSLRTIKRLSEGNDNTSRGAKQLLVKMNINSQSCKKVSVLPHRIVGEETHQSLFVIGDNGKLCDLPEVLKIATCDATNEIGVVTRDREIFIYDGITGVRSTKITVPRVIPGLLDFNKDLVLIDTPKLQLYSRKKKKSYVSDINIGSAIPVAHTWDQAGDIANANHINVLLDSNAIFRYDLQSEDTTSINIPPLPSCDIVSKMLLLNSNEHIIATLKSLFLMDFRTTGIASPIKLKNQLHSMARLSDNKILLGTSAGVLLFDTRHSTPVQVEAIPTSHSMVCTSSIGTTSSHFTTYGVENHLTMWSWSELQSFTVPLPSPPFHVALGPTSAAVLTGHSLFKLDLVSSDR